MAHRTWTILLVADDSIEVRQFRLSREMMRSAIALIVVTFCLVVALTAQVLVRLDGPRQTFHLRRENVALKSQLGLVQSQVDALGSTLENLTEQDTQFRLMAGLEPLDADVQKAGIGGPDTETLERSALWRINRAAGERLFNASAELSGMLRRAHVLS